MANTTANFSRLHTWGATDTVLQVDLNNEFNNILSNLNPIGMGSYSINVAQMQIQTGPGGVGSEVLATSLAGELERLRFQIATLQGTTYWYQTPSSTIAQLNSALGAALLGNRVSSGVATTTGQPAYLIPDGTTNRVTLATSTPFVYSVNGTQYTLSSNVTLSGLTLAAASAGSTTMVVNDATITSGQTWTQTLGEYGSSLTVATMGSTINGLIGKIAAFKNTNSGELFVARVASSTIVMDASRGFFQTGASSFATRANVTNGDTLELMSLAWIYASTAGSLSAVYTNPTYSGTAPSGPSIGDYWFNTSTNIWETYNGSAWVTANATLIGVTVQDTTKTAGSRSFDFFNSYSSNNALELFASTDDAAFAARSRYIGASISVYGTGLSFTKAYVGWSASGTGLIDGTTLTTGNIYYFYLSSAGNTFVSSISPYNRSDDLYGFYHPSNPYRCVGFGVCSNSGSALFSDIESFFKNDNQTAVSNVTAAGLNLLQPYTIATYESMVECNASGGAFTQIVPPPSTWKGKRLFYVKTDNSTNAVTLQAWGTSVLTTTCTTTLAGTQISSLVSTTGLVANQPYLVSGPGIQLGTTVTWASSTTATLSQNAVAALTTSAVTFATVPNLTYVANPRAGISGNFTTTLNTLGECVELLSDGFQAVIVNRRIPSQIFPYSAVFLGLGTVTVQNISWSRVGPNVGIQGYLQVGTATATTASISLPSVTVASSLVDIGGSLLSLVGYGGVNVAGASPLTMLTKAGATVLNMSIGTGSINPILAQLGNTIFTTTSFVTIEASIPVQGWNP